MPFDPSRITAENADDYFQMGARIHLSHPSMPPGVLERTSHTTMRLTIEEDVQTLQADQFAPFCARAIIDGIAMELEIPHPEWVAVGPGTATVVSLLREKDYFTRTYVGSVEESIKYIRGLVSKDLNGIRRFLVHPRCKLLRYEMKRYRKDFNRPGHPIIKAHDNAVDTARYIAIKSGIEQENDEGDGG